VVFSPPIEQKGKEVKKYMKRIIKVLVVSALMMVLMASSVSPAFAYHRNYEPHYKGQTDEDTHGYAGHDPYWTGNEKENDGNDGDKCVYGWTSENKETKGGQQKDGYSECNGNIYN
jgi:hypothetical protein